MLHTDRDMSGWAAQTTRGTDPFTSTTVFGADQPNLIGYGEPTRAWVAVCDHGEELVRFVPPGS